MDLVPVEREHEVGNCVVGFNAGGVDVGHVIEDLGVRGTLLVAGGWVVDSYGRGRKCRGWSHCFRLKLTFPNLFCCLFLYSFYFREGFVAKRLRSLSTQSSCRVEVCQDVSSLDHLFFYESELRFAKAANTCSSMIIGTRKKSNIYTFEKQVDKSDRESREW